jgi:hypothetical protein
MSDETFHVPLHYIQEYLSGIASRLQQPLDDAISRAEDRARLEGTIQRVIIEIDPAATG